MNAFFAKLVNYLNGSSWWTSLVIHSMFAVTVVYHVALGFHVNVWRVAAVAVALAAIKEYYWDKHFEIPAQTFADSSIDFGGYMLGIVLALAFTHWSV